MKRAGEDREVHSKLLTLEQINLEVRVGVWLAIQREPGLIPQVGPPKKVLKAGETGAMLDVIRETYHLEEAVIKNNKRPENILRLFII